MKKNLLRIFVCLVNCMYFIGCNSTANAQESYSLFKYAGLYGIISSDRNIVMPPAYDYISINLNSIICSKGRTKEIYSASLKLLYSSGDKFTSLKFYTENEILIKESMTGKSQILNVVSGKIRDFKENKKYNIEEGYRDNVGLVWEKGKSSFLYSIVNTKGKVILTDIDQAHNCFSNGMIAVIMKDGKSGFVNKKGEMVIETSFYIDPDDIAPRKYPMIRYFFKDDYALVKNAEKKWLQYNINGEEKAFPSDMEPNAYCYESGLVPVLNKETMKYGYMNPDFKIVIPCQFTEADGFCGQYACVIYSGKNAVIDREGNLFFSENLVKNDTQ